MPFFKVWEIKQSVISFNLFYFDRCCSKHIFSHSIMQWFAEVTFSIAINSHNMNSWNLLSLKLIVMQCIPIWNRYSRPQTPWNRDLNSLYISCTKHKMFSVTFLVIQTISGKKPNCELNKCDLASNRFVEIKQHNRVFQLWNTISVIQVQNKSWYPRRQQQQPLNVHRENWSPPCLLLTHFRMIIQRAHHSLMNLILRGLRAQDGDVGCTVITGMAWAMTSANSFINGLSLSEWDKIQLQRFLWAQQWPAINILREGFPHSTTHPHTYWCCCINTQYVKCSYEHEALCSSFPPLNTTCPRDVHFLSLCLKHAAGFCTELRCPRK